LEKKEQFHSQKMQVHNAHFIIRYFSILLAFSPTKQGSREVQR